MTSDPEPGEIEHDWMAEIQDEIRQFREGCYYEPDFSIEVSSDVWESVLDNNFIIDVFDEIPAIRKYGFNPNPFHPPGTIIVRSEGIKRNRTI